MWDFARKRDDRTVQIYATDMDELLEIAKSRVTRQLTAEEKEKYGVLDLNWFCWCAVVSI